MSLEAMGWVIRCSPYEGSTHAILLNIADTANEQYEFEFWMRQGKLMRKSRWKRSAVQKALATLISDGVLVVLVEGKGRGEPTKYRLVMSPDAPVVYDVREPGGVPKAEQPATRAPQEQPATRAPGAHEQGTLVPATRAPGARHASTVDRSDPKADPKAEPKGRAIATEVWERSDPKPAQPFIAVQKLAAKLLDAGHSHEAIVEAMLAVPTISTGWVETQLRQAKGRRPGRRQENERLTTDDGEPSGRVQ